LIGMKLWIEVAIGSPSSVSDLRADPHDSRANIYADARHSTMI